MGIKVKLKKPVTDLGTELTELEFRDPVFGDILAAGTGNEMEIAAVLIERCANIAAPTVKQMAIKDVYAVMAKLKPFLDF